MGLVPDKILTDPEIDRFVDTSNDNAEKIVGESKYKITPVAIPGIGLLIKLFIRIFEKGYATNISPAAKLKKTISGSKPKDLIKNLRNDIGDINTFFEDPLQAMLDQAPNKDIANESPFPAKFLHDESGNGADLLKRELDNANKNHANEASNSNLANSGYVYDFYYSDDKYEEPEEGRAIINSSSLGSTTYMQASFTDSSGNDTEQYLRSLEYGDIIAMSYKRQTLPFKILGTHFYDNWARLRVVRDGDTTLDNINGLRMEYPARIDLGDGQIGVSSPFSMDPNSSRFNPGLIPVKSLISDGSMKISLAAILVGFPLASLIAVNLGNVSDLAPENPTRKYVGDKEKETGFRMPRILASIFSGRWPVLDFNKVKRGDRKEKNKESFLNLAKFFELAVKKPLFFIGIVVNYFKMLLLPIAIVFGVLKAILGKIGSVTGAIKFVIQLVSSPTRFFCDLTGTVVLDALTSYLSPPLNAAGVTYEEAKETKERGRNLGLKFLISDILCGVFLGDFNRYTPNEGELTAIEESIERKPLSAPSLLGDEASAEDVSFPYRILYGSYRTPEEGQVIFNLREIASKNVIRFNTKDITGTSSLNYLAYTGPGQTIKMNIDGKDWEYTVISMNPGAEVFGFNVSLKKKPILSERDIKDLDADLSLSSGKKSDSINVALGTIDQTIASLESSLSENPPNANQISRKVLGLKTVRSELAGEQSMSIVSVKNPDKMYLFLSEKYLPSKVIAAWESVKGIIGIILGTLIALPTLIPAVFRSVFSSTGATSSEDANKSDLGIATSTVADLIDKFGFFDDDGMLKQMNIESEVDGEGEPRKSIREVIDEMLYVDEAEERIESAFLALESDVNESDFSLTVDGEAITYKELIRRLKIQIGIYEKLKDKTIYLPTAIRNQRRYDLNEDIAKVDEDIKREEVNLRDSFNRLESSGTNLSLAQTGIINITSSASVPSALEAIRTNISTTLYQSIKTAYNANAGGLTSDLRSINTETEKNLDSLTSFVDGINDDTLADEYEEASKYASELLSLGRSTSEKTKAYVDELGQIVSDLDAAQSANTQDLSPVRNDVDNYRTRINDQLSKVNSANTTLKNESEFVAGSSRRLSEYIETDERLLYYKTVLQLPELTRLWEDTNLKNNYFRDEPIEIDKRLKFMEDQIEGDLITLHVENTIRGDVRSRVQVDYGILLTDFRNLVLKEISKAGEIIRAVE